MPGVMKVPVWFILVHPSEVAGIQVVLIHFKTSVQAQLDIKLNRHCMPSNLETLIERKNTSTHTKKEICSSHSIHWHQSGLWSFSLQRKKKLIPKTPALQANLAHLDLNRLPLSDSTSVNVSSYSFHTQPLTWCQIEVEPLYQNLSLRFIPMK